MEIEPVLRLLAALAAGLVLGIERDAKGHAAGVRTHVLVAVGAAVFTLAGAYGFPEIERSANADPMRVAAQVASGIGFIGAGAIMRNGASVKGLTTAATLWLAASLGVMAGSGAYLLLIVATGLVLVTLLALPWIRPTRWSRTQAVRFRIRCQPGPSSLPAVIRVLGAYGADIRSIDIIERPNHERTDVRVEASMTRAVRLSQVTARLTATPEVIDVKVKKAEGSSRT